MKKTIKTTFIVLFGLLSTVILAVVIAPSFFKDKLVKVVKVEINKQVEGEVDFKDIDVTWWSTFPDVAVTIADLSISGLKADSSQQDLFFASRVGLGLDFMSVWSQGDSLEVKSFTLNDPTIFIVVDEKGQANYDLIKKTNAPNSTKNEGIKFDLSNYFISNASLQYIDVNSGLHISMQETDHTGTLTYETSQLTWDATLKSPNLSYTQNGVPYLQRANLNFDGGLKFDLENKKYSFLDNDLLINALQLFFEGDVTQKGDDIVLDVNIKSRKNTFKSFLSVLPNLYAADFKKIKTKGNLLFSGRVEGVYSAKAKTFPTYDFNVKVDNGWFQVPGKTMALDEIFVTSRINNNNRSFTPSTIHVPVFTFLLNGEKISGNIDIKNQGNNQLFDGALKGKINLADAQNAYPMPSVTELSGLLDIDAALQGNTTAIAKNDWNQLSYRGFVNGQNVIATLDGQPKLALNQFTSKVDDDQLIIDHIKGKIGQSDFIGNGKISPISALIIDNPTPLALTVDLKGNTLNVDELMDTDSKTEDSTDQPPTKGNETLRKMQFNAKGAFDNVVYEEYRLKNIKTDVVGSLQSLSINSFNGNVNNDNISASGRINNIYDYTYHEGTVDGVLQLNSKSFNLDHWMVTDDEISNSNSTTAPTYAVIPDRMDLVVNIDVDELQYDNIDVRRAKGKVKVKNQRVSFENVKGNTMGGQFGLGGYYAFAGEGEPLFKVAYDISKFSFEQTFQKVETAKYLLPIIQFIKGTFNSNMTFEGFLKPGYMPDLSNLDGNGLLETLHGGLLDNPTLEKISKLVNLDELKRLTIDRSRNKFSVKQGELKIEPFEKTVDDIFALISGSHKLNGDMNYKMALTIPTEKFDVKGFPISIKKQFNTVQKQLNKMGLPLEQSESIRVDVIITGSLTNPDLAVKLVDFSKESVKDAVKNAANDIVNQAKDSISDVTKTKVIDIVQGDNKDSSQTNIKDAVRIRVKDEVNTKIEEEVNPVKDTLIAKTQEVVKDKIKTDVLDNVDDDVKDKANDILDNFNPFKKKKKDGK